MAHPKVTRRIKGRLWHLEDRNLPVGDAKALARHLRRTEDKRASVTKGESGHNVWWAKR